jgi:predicted Zn-dependent protease with MMP-like domain
MDRNEFERLVEEEYANAIPEKFRDLIHNVALLVEDEPDGATRMEEGLGPHETLLGLYRGIPATARGDHYGVGSTLPDTITLYMLPILEEAAAMSQDVRQVIRETIWHEVAHHFGYDEGQVRGREAKRDRGEEVV